MQLVRQRRLTSSLRAVPARPGSCRPVSSHNGSPGCPGRDLHRRLISGAGTQGTSTEWHAIGLLPQGWFSFGCGVKSLGRPQIPHRHWTMGRRLVAEGPHPPGCFSCSCFGKVQPRSRPLLRRSSSIQFHLTGLQAHCLPWPVSPSPHTANWKVVHQSLSGAVRHRHLSRSSASAWNYLHSSGKEYPAFKRPKKRPASGRRDWGQAGGFRGGVWPCELGDHDVGAFDSEGVDDGAADV